MHTRRWNWRTGSVLVAIGLFAAGVATAAPAAAKDNRAATQTTLTATPNTSSTGQAVTLKATLSFNRSGNRVPTGLVYYAASNGNALVYQGSASVGGCSLVTRKCTATLVTTHLPTGHDGVGAVYAGNNWFKPSGGVTSATVNGQAPGAPTLTGATAGDGQVALQWSAPTSGGPVSTYNVYRSTTQGVQGPLLTSGLTGTTYTDPNATNDSTYYYVVTASNGSGQSPESNELSAHPPSSSATTCPSGTTCNSPTVNSTDGSTALDVTAAASTGSQTLTTQVGGLPDMLCSLAGSGAVTAEYHTSASDAGKVADYTVFGDAAVFAQDFYAAHTDTSGCYGADDQWNGYSPAPPDCTECTGGTWADGPYVYGPVPFDSDTGLFEGFLGSCANHSGYQPCFTNIASAGSNDTQVHSPNGPNDPRITH